MTAPSGANIAEIRSMRFTARPKKFPELESSRDPMTVYIHPEIVVEIAFNEIQASSQYPGGVTLRFARVKRYRDDKTAAEVDTIATILAMYQASRP